MWMPTQQQRLTSIRGPRRERRPLARRRFLPKAPARAERFPLLLVAEKLI
jgi:hypothetical protein